LILSQDQTLVWNLMSADG